MGVFYAVAFHKVGMDPPFEHESAQKVSETCFLFNTRNVLTYYSRSLFSCHIMLESILSMGRLEK